MATPTTRQIIDLLPECIIHTEYDIASPPARAGPEYTRFVCISDTHGSTFPVPDDDVLLHSGDLSEYGREHLLRKTALWLQELPHKVKIAIAGNHDLDLDTSLERDSSVTAQRLASARDLFEGPAARASGLIYLQHSAVEIQVRPDGRRWRVYGSPGTPEYGGGAFMYERGEAAREVHSRIPSDTDILLTHGPPDGILDEATTDERPGCADLLSRLEEIRPILHVFGHIHHSHGVHIQEWTSNQITQHEAGVSRTRTICVNAANTPAGWKARELREQGIKPTKGGRYFQPVIVDLLDQQLGS